MVMGLLTNLHFFGKGICYIYNNKNLASKPLSIYIYIYIM